MTWQLDSLLEGLLDGPVPAIPVSGLSLSAQTLRPGEVFIALAGQNRHGLDFAAQAAERGAAAILWEPRPDHPVMDDAGQPPRLAVPGLRAQLGELAARFYGRPGGELTLIGVTGTNGKSSCVHFLGQALSRTRRCGTIGTLGAGLVGEEAATTHTTPDAIALQRELRRLRDQGAEVVAMEVSSHALEQGRVNALDFDGAVFTNLTRDHLDYHGSMAAYRAAKSRLFAVPGLRFAILNADDPSHEAFRAQLDETVTVIHYGIGRGDVRARSLKQDGEGLAFELDLGGARRPIRAGLLGRFNVSNLLAVAAVLHALDWDADAIAEALSALRPVPGRMNRLGGGRQPLVVVDYAHTPDALENSLQALRDHAAGHLTVVFGCGGDRDAGKRPMMGEIAVRDADRVIVTDDNPRSEDGDAIVSDILAGMSDPDRVRVIRDRAAAIATAIHEAGAGDVVLVAGKGHEDYQEIQGVRQPFDDRRVAARELGVQA